MSSTGINIPGTWTAEGDFYPADGSKPLLHDPNPTPEFEVSFPYGWNAPEVDADPIQAILEHTYGNCPCSDSDECLRNIAAIGEKAKAK